MINYRDKYTEMHGQQNVRINVESYSKNKLEKLVLLVGCIIRMAQWLLGTKYFKNAKGY